MLSEMEAQEHSGNCNKSTEGSFQLGSMFPSMASYSFLGPLYSTVFKHERQTMRTTDIYQIMAYII